MAYQALTKIQVATAAEVCAHYDLENEARTLLRNNKKANPLDFVESLMARQQYLSGIEFIAHALPAREAIWWGCLCLQHAYGDRLAGASRTACQAAVRWVIKPNEENRAAADGPAEMAGLGSTAGNLALAVKQSGQAATAAKSVVRAIKLAALRCGPAAMIGTQKAFLDLGLKVAAGEFIG